MLWIDTEVLCLLIQLQQLWLISVEREENVKADIFHAYITLLKQTKPSSIQDQDSMELEEGCVCFLCVMWCVYAVGRKVPVCHDPCIVSEWLDLSSPDSSIIVVFLVNCWRALWNTNGITLMGHQIQVEYKNLRFLLFDADYAVAKCLPLFPSVCPHVCCDLVA